MNLDLDDGARSGYPPMQSMYDSGAAHRQRGVPGVQASNTPVVGQVRDFGGFQVTNFGNSPEQHQPQLTNDFGQFNTYGSGGGLPRDDGLPPGYHGMQTYNLQQQQAAPQGSPGRMQMPHYQNTLGVGAEDEQLGHRQGYGGGNMHPTQYMHPPANQLMMGGHHPFNGAQDVRASYASARAGRGP